MDRVAQKHTAYRRAGRALAICASAVLLMAFGSCSKKATTGSIKISWDANHEAAMNVAGAGYRIWVSQQEGFATSSVSPTDLPYSGGLTTSYVLSNAASGTWYVRLQAYTSSGESQVSAATPVGVP